MYSFKISMLARQIPLAAVPKIEPILRMPADQLPGNCEGFVTRSMPVSGNQPRFRDFGTFFCYIPDHFPRYFIDLTICFEDYKRKFSSKTRANLQKKIKRWKDHVGGEIRWGIYQTVDELEDFYRLARIVSKKTYQERLLDAGLPNSERFRLEMLDLARSGKVRAYLIFDGDEPVSYLYCPIECGNVVYAHLGYDPSYKRFSVGTVLQWLALESLFGEKRFNFYDFTEGDSDHKRLFSTSSLWSANAYFMRDNFRNRCVTILHAASIDISNALGVVADRVGAKTWIRKAMRLGLMRRVG